MVPFFNQHHILLLSKHANNLKDICLFRLYRKIESLLNECIITIEVNTVKITQKCSKRKHSFLSEDMSMPSNISSILIDYDSLTKARLLVDQLKNYAWETLHSTHWRSIPIPARDIYALATYLHTSLTLALNNITRIKSINDEDNQINSKTINQMVIELDKALLLGGPLMRNDLQYLLHHLTSTYASILYRPLIFNPSTNSRSSNTSDNNSSSGNNNDINIYDGSNLKGKLRRCCPRGPGKRREIPIINNPDLHVFLTQYMESDTPAVLRDCSDENEWPALSRWSDLEYFNKVCGCRTVPVETGSSYLSVDSGQALMSMRQFIQQYILHYDPVDVKNDMIDSNNDSNKISSSNSDSSSGNRNSNRKNNDTVKGYLAQHRLFDQIPILRADFTAPDYCALLTARDEDFLTLTISNSDNTTYSSGSSSSGDFYGRDTLEEDVSVNMWFGPSDTQSPLHHDPFHNLLVQVHGYKYVRLYPSSESDKLYPREGRLYNNSSVDVLCPNLNIHPEFEEAVYWDIVLKPGDTLYIPRWCWHFVLALDHHCVLTDEHIRSSTTIDLTSSEDNCKCSSHKNSNNHIEDMKSLFCVSVNFWWGPRIEKQ